MERLRENRTITLLLLLFLLIPLTNSYAQITVSGTVNDDFGKPLVGVSVMLKGEGKGVITDINGYYSILTPHSNSVLTYSYIGYRPVEQVVGDRTFIQIILTEDSREIEEVVVIGYGHLRKSDLTGAVASVKGEEVKIPFNASVGAGLQGTAAGVEVATISYSPGGRSQVRVRGIGTLNDNDPLYVVDGMPVSSIDYLLPNDIERVEVLKDASSAAIYGARGANGVILITTLQGRKMSKFKVTFDGSAGSQSAANLTKMAGPQEYALIKNAARVNSGKTPLFSDTDITAMNGGTNWLDEITRSAPIQNYTLSMTGGSDKTSYASSLNYFDQEGIVKGSDYRKINARLNTEIEATERLNVGVIFTFNNIIQNSISEKNVRGSVINNALMNDPLTPVYKSSDKKSADWTGVPEEYLDNEYSIFMRSKYASVNNPVGQIARTYNTLESYITTVNGFARYELMKGLSLKTAFGIDYFSTENKVFSPTYWIATEEKNEVNSIQNISAVTMHWAWENTLNYENIFNKIHRINVVAGYTMEYNTYKMVLASKQNIPGNSPDYQYLELATENDNNSGQHTKNTLMSYLARANYSLMDRYILTASLRADGSSRFASGNRWGVFPAVSGAWIISNENFMPDWKWLDYLKLRAGYGTIGNQSIADNSYVNLVGVDSRYPFGNDKILNSGYGLLVPGNKDVKWETTEDLNVGIDLHLFNSLNLTVDMYQRKTKDMLLFVPIAGFTGLAYDPYNQAGVWDNAGTMQNRGIEFSANYQGASGDFKYKVGGNISFTHNKVLELGGYGVISSGSFWDLGYVTRTEAGSSIGRFYGYRTNGIFQSDEEVRNYTYTDPKTGSTSLIQPNAKAGDFIFMDINNDGVITDADKEYIGSPLPKFSGGFNFYVDYKGFDLAAHFYGVYGNKIMDGMKAFSESGMGTWNSREGLYDRAWTPENHSATHPRLSENDTNGNFNKFSDFYLEDGSYLRLKSLQVGYTFGTKICEAMRIHSLRVYVGAQNLFTLTRYKGMEPDLTSMTVTAMGIDYANYPSARTFLGGLRIVF